METSGLPPAEPRLAPATAISPAVIVPDSARASPPKETTLNPPEQPVKAWLEFSSEPNGAKVFRNGELIGTTPLRSAEFLAGDATFLFVREGYLPRELKAAIDPAKGFKDSVSLVQPAPVYTGEIRVLNEGSASSRPIEIKLNSDLRSGTMTQSSKRGDFVVKFTGVWDGTILHSVTSDVISQPHGIQWAPESFILRFGDDGKSASYQCVAEGKTYGADLSAQSPSAVRAASVYKGTIRREGDERGAGVPLTITLASDRKSGTQTQSSKSGDTIVKFNGVWDGRTLRAVTDEVVSKPKNIQWKPESFTLKFANDWATAVYECNAEGQLFTAKLSVP
jgi:hypothetical protein